jgi:hypothetical protein
VGRATQYIDGLGRPLQKVFFKESPLKKDIVQVNVYDAHGREALKFLPYVSTEDNGLLKSSPVGSITIAYSNSPHYAFYNNGQSDKISDDPKAFAETGYEFSPLNRVLEQGAPGTDFQPREGATYSAPGANNYSIKFDYSSNESEEVLNWSYTDPTSNAPLGIVEAGNATSRSYYPQNKLYKTRTKDEHNNEIIEYKDIATRSGSCKSSICE